MQNFVPPLVGENHSCSECGYDYSTVSVETARATIVRSSEEIREVALSIPDANLRRRPDSVTWSPLEYVCHVRDVFATYTLRLHRTRTEETPTMEPMYNDLRATRFRYNERNLIAVLDELRDNAQGLIDEMDTTPDSGWQRRAVRFPGEARTALWLVRQAAHEGAHHRLDLTAVAERLARTPAS